MINVDIRNLVPAFILGDRNGYAAAKALETGLSMFCQILQDGINNTLRVDTMPEWRLDEMAWELDCLYDHDGKIENKRAWIRDAVPLYASYGTIEAVYRYLSGYFSDVEAEENWQYGGEPYHFRVTVGGEWTDAKERWAKRAIEATKNVRSVLDDLAVGGSITVTVAGETKWWRMIYEMTTGDTLTGTLPQESTVGCVAEGKIAAFAAAEAHRFPYEMATEDMIAGTTPQESLAGCVTEDSIVANIEAAGFQYPYELTGTIPQETSIGEITEGLLSTTAEAAGFRYPYELAGTIPKENTVSAQGGAMATAQSDGSGAVFSYPQAGDNSLCGENEL